LRHNKIKYPFAAVSLCVLSLSVCNVQAQQKEAISSEKKVAPVYVIETQVQGSQEQPKVLYITPWQELDSSISIDEHNLTIRLPKLSAVNPKVFRKKVNSYYQQQEEK